MPKPWPARCPKCRWPRPRRAPRPRRWRKTPTGTPPSSAPPTTTWRRANGRWPRAACSRRPSSRARPRSPGWARLLRASCLPTTTRWARRCVCVACPSPWWACWPPRGRTRWGRTRTTSSSCPCPPSATASGMRAATCVASGPSTSRCAPGPTWRGPRSPCARCCASACVCPRVATIPSASATCRRCCRRRKSRAAWPFIWK
jgi:hypothetical protein